MKSINVKFNIEVEAEAVITLDALNIDPRDYKDFDAYWQDLSCAIETAVEQSVVKLPEGYYLNDVPELEWDDSEFYDFIIGKWNDNSIFRDGITIKLHRRVV